MLILALQLMGRDYTDEKEYAPHHTSCPPRTRLLAHKLKGNTWRGSSWHKDGDGNITTRHLNGNYTYKDKYGNVTKRGPKGERLED